MQQRTRSPVVLRRRELGLLSARFNARCSLSNVQSAASILVHWTTETSCPEEGYLERQKFPCSSKSGNPWEKTFFCAQPDAKRIFRKKEQTPFRSCGGTRRRKKEITKLDKRKSFFLVKLWKAQQVNKIPYTMHILVHRTSGSWATDGPTDVTETVLLKCLSRVQTMTPQTPRQKKTAAVAASIQLDHDDYRKHVSIRKFLT